MKSSSHSRRIIGITGPFGSGKTTAANILKKYGYFVTTLSSPLEEEAKKRNLPLTRKVLQDLGNELRSKEGSGILMKIAIESSDAEKLVVDGLRNIGEIEELRKHGNSVVLAIIADKRVRYKRLKKLKRREELTPELFNELDLRDLGVNEKITGLQTAFCISLADAFIDSNESLEQFEKDIEKFVVNYDR